jgi:regulator of nucleoside diphosphate kinase
MAFVFALERTLTQIDYVRLTRLLTEQSSASNAAALDELLSLSELVPSPEVPADIVTMHSRVLLRSEPGGVTTKVSICYPANADPAAGSVSVLAPLGLALLGLRVGDVAQWTGPGGEPHAGRIVQMLFQPEATGDYTT